MLPKGFNVINQIHTKTFLPIIGLWYKTFAMNIPTKLALDVLRLQGDAPADEAVARMFEEESPRVVLQQVWALQNNQNLQENSLPTYIKNYLAQVVQPITATTYAYINHNANFFQQNAQPYLGMLGLLSLPYCYAGEYGAQVLYLSDRIQNQIEKRLLETSKFLLDVLSVDAFLPTGKGWVSIAQVRLLHAIIRKRIQALPEWNMQWGVPINQEDMLGTNFAFGWIVARGMEKIGYQVTAYDREALLESWRVIGCGLGVLPTIMPQNAKEAYILDKRIAERHFRASVVGKLLTKALVEYLQPKFPLGLTETYMRFLLGDTIADYIGIAPTDWKRYLLRVQILQTRLQEYLPFSLLPEGNFLDNVRELIQKEGTAFTQQ